MWETDIYTKTGRYDSLLASSNSGINISAISHRITIKTVYSTSDIKLGIKKAWLPLSPINGHRQVIIFIMIIKYNICKIQDKINELIDNDDAVT